MSLRGYITNNVWWKLLSLLLAAFTWLTIQTSFQQDQLLLESPVETVSKRTFSAIPVTTLTSNGVTNRFVLDPPTVEVEVSGPIDLLKKLRERDVVVYVDLSTVGDEVSFRRPLLTTVPKGLEVSSISQLQINVERVRLTR